MLPPAFSGRLAAEGLKRDTGVKFGSPRSVAGLFSSRPRPYWPSSWPLAISWRCTLPA
jgi:hypothetical protein